MNLPDSQITTLVNTGTPQAFSQLNAAFIPFGDTDPTFQLGTAPEGAGAFEVERQDDTREDSEKAFGNAPIFLWLYKGASRTTATEYLLVKLSYTFPADTEDDNTASIEIYLRPTTATLFAGFVGPQTHNYGKGGGAATIFRMTTMGPPSSNQPPVAVSGTLSAIAGVAKTGQLAATDAESNPLTFRKTGDPAKGTVVIQASGSFVYTASVGQTGPDSFRFRANDGQSDSNEGTISVTISAPPPNAVPVAVKSNFSVSQDDLLTNTVMGTDADNDPLSFAVGSGPSQGVLSLRPDGSFSYRPNSRFTGEDSFSFTVNDGKVTSAATPVVIVVRPASPEWVWIKGAQQMDQNGTYGALNVPAPANGPGARSQSASTAVGKWLYVFGGTGRGASGNRGFLNDLWRFDSATQEWTWISGGTETNTPGIYGSPRVEGDGLVPGGRAGATLWADAQGSLWLFGGTGRGLAASSVGELNDLWRFDPSTGRWAWFSGSAGINEIGAYGVLGVASEGNAPGGRSGATGWRDNRGRLWLFGGRGRGTSVATVGLLNDLWCFDPASNQWTHHQGSSGVNALGVYGSDTQEVPNQAPGARTGASSWLDVEGRVWLFGGQGFAASGSAGFLNDLWTYDPDSGRWKGGVYRASTSQWRTSPGPERTNVAGVNGTRGLASMGNYPSARAGAVAALAADGKLLLFGGSGAGAFSDVWSFDPTTSNWTWLKGPSAANQPGIYGLQGVASASTSPGARSGSSGFLAPSGQLWIFAGTQGSRDFSDGWSLHLPITPTVHLTRVVKDGETRATIEASVRVNVGAGDTEVAIEYAKVGSNASGVWSSVNLPTLPPSTSEVILNGALSNLEAGTTYDVRVRCTNAAGTGLSFIRRVTTDGVRISPLVVRFVEATSAVQERTGSVSLEVRLSAPAPERISIPIAQGGDAQVDSDYSLQASEVIFLEGQTRAWFVVRLVNNSLINPSRTLELSLGQPSSPSVGLGSPLTHLLQIIDDDAATEVTVNSALAELGATTTLVATVSNPGTSRFQWKKAGRRIAGATTAVLTFPAVRLADAGAYTVDVIMPGARVVTSSIAELLVVDTTPRRVLGAVGKPFTLSVSTAGSGLSYEWTRAGSPTLLTSEASYAKSSAMLEDGGDYQCVVKKVGVGQLTCAVSLSIVTENPQFNLLQLPDGFVGASYVHRIVAANTPAGEADAFSVTGLPRGLVASADGWITGVPIAPVTNKPITVVASNPFGSTEIQFTLTILPLPTVLAGIYGASFEPVAAVTGGALGGRVDLTVSPSGSYTAQLLTGAESRTARGPVQLVAQDGSALQVLAQFTRTGMPPIRIALSIKAAPNAGEWEVSGGLLDAAGNPVGLVSGVKLAAQTTRTGSYNYGLLLDESVAGALAVPQGDGFGTSTLSATGRATFAGRTADGSSHTAASVVGRNGDIPIYLSAVSLATPGGLAGMGRAIAGTINGLEGDLKWTRAAALVTSKTRGYRSGFESVPLSLVGGVYAGPEAGQVIAGLDPTRANNVQIMFANTSFIEGSLARLIFSISNAGGVRQMVTIPLNPARISFKLDRTPGSFSGGFTVAGATPALDRTAIYRGLFVRLPSGNFMAAGHYLLAQPPEPGVAKTAAPELSGRVMVLEAAP